MAKKTTVAEVTTVTVKDLIAQYNLDGKRLRAIIRSLGFRAPATNLPGMAPQAKYEWPSDSKNLAKIHVAITDYISNLEELEEDAE